MRVVGGNARGTRLYGPPDSMEDALRPTADRIKEDVFNILSHRAPTDASWLDAYCGTGQIGIEALSRGARHAVFLDSSPHSLDIARRNIQKCKIPSHAYTLMQADAPEGIGLMAAQQGLTFDVAFLDPPYSEDCATVLSLIIEAGLLANGGLMVLEQGAAHQDTAYHPDLKVWKVKEYRVARVIFMEYIREGRA